MQIELYDGELNELHADLLIFIQDQQYEFYKLPEDHGLTQHLNALKPRFASKELKQEYIGCYCDQNTSFDMIVFNTILDKYFPLTEKIKIFTAQGVRYAAKTGKKKVVLALNHPQSIELVEKAVEGALVGSYSFDKYKLEPQDLYTDLNLILWVKQGEIAQQHLHQGRVVAEAVNRARDLINEPADVITPEALALQAKESASRLGLDYELWDTERLKASRCVGLLKVGAGSKHPPRMFRLTYKPTQKSEAEDTDNGGTSPEASPHLIFLGKGVTFDTGGISLKPSDKMHLMKGDMSGAAAVLATMEALGVLKPKIKVTGLIVSAENTPDANSYRPGDILKFSNGKSVHVENTDAEGRLILADGLIQTGKLGATHVVDIATLTGACARALGPSFIGLMGNSRRLLNAVTIAGGNRGESLWKLPLPQEYKELLKSPVADLNNIGGPMAGAITAGLFLQEFVPEGVAWAHLDIAGTFWKQKPWKHYTEGPSGAGVKTLVDLALNWHDYLS